MEYDPLYGARLAAMRGRDGRAEGAIAAYLLDHPERLNRLTVQTLAEETHTSYATVCRFFRKLGVGGFRAFRKRFGAAWGSDASEAPTDTCGALCRRVCAVSADVIGNLPQLLGGETLERAAHLFETAERVLWVGLGTSAVTARYACVRFFRVKPTCTFEEDVIVAKMRASQLRPGDLLGAVSSSGRTRGILDIARVARANGASVLSICDFVGTPLQGISDIGLATTWRDAVKYAQTDFPLVGGQAAVVDVLFACATGRTASRADAMLRQTEEAVSPDKLPG